MSRRKRRNRRIEGDSELMLAAMVDMMINVLIFLLAMYGTGGARPPDGLDLSPSVAKDYERSAVVIVVAKTGIFIDGTQVVRADGFTAVDEAVKNAPLKDLLAKRYQDAIDGKDPQDAESEPTLEIQAARDAPWNSLRLVLDAAGKAGFVKLRFTARPQAGVGG